MARIRDLRDYLRVLESLGDVERIDRLVSADAGGGRDHAAVDGAGASGAVV